MEQAGFALVEAFGVEGLFEAEEFVVQVVAEFVEKSPEEGAEGDDPTVFRRPYPHGHAIRPPGCGGPTASRPAGFKPGPYGPEVPRGRFHALVRRTPACLNAFAVTISRLGEPH